MTNPKAVGSSLVAMQFGILLVLLWLTAAQLRAALPDPLSWGLWLAGGALGCWSLVANRPGNFNIRPTPKAGGALVEQGPYRWIRHPMYSALLLLGAGCAWFLASALAWLLWALLAGVLARKSSLEELLMLAVHPEYAQYRVRTRRFLPYLI